MKRYIILLTIVMTLMIGVTPEAVNSQQSGSCYFEASEDIYLKIYDLDKDGVERGAKWEGRLPAGGKKSFHAPYGQVGFAVKKEKDDPWEESQESCQGGEAIPIP